MKTIHILIIIFILIVIFGKHSDPYRCSISNPSDKYLELKEKLNEADYRYNETKERLLHWNKYSFIPSEDYTAYTIDYNAFDDSRIEYNNIVHKINTYCKE